MGSVVIRTRQITREKLAQFFPGNHELQRLLEAMTQDIVVNIPDALDPTTVISEDGSDLAQTAMSLAIAARAVAQEALAAARQANEGPPTVPAVIAQDHQPPVGPVVLPDIPDDLTAMLASLRERLAVAERAIAELREGPTL